MPTLDCPTTTTCSPPPSRSPLSHLQAVALVAALLLSSLELDSTQPTLQPLPFAMLPARSQQSQQHRLTVSHQPTLDQEPLKCAMLSLARIPAPQLQLEGSHMTSPSHLLWTASAPSEVALAVALWSPSPDQDLQPLAMK